MHGLDAAEGELEASVGRLLRSRRLTLSVAESCTGGLILHRLTNVPGASAYLDRGVVCYSDLAKIEWLGVSPAVVKRYGAVSPQAARAMAKGIQTAAGTGLGLAVSGIAGPGGGSAAKPVGLVYVALATPRRTVCRRYRCRGGRDQIKAQASTKALGLIRRYLAGRS